MSHIDLGVAAAVVLILLGFVAVFFGNEDLDGNALLLVCCCGGGFIAAIVIGSHHLANPVLASWMTVIGGVLAFGSGCYLLDKVNSGKRSNPVLCAAALAGFLSVALRMTQSVLVGTFFDHGDENQLAPSAHTASNIAGMFALVLTLLYILLLIIEYRQGARQQAEDAQRSDAASRVQAPCTGNCDHGEPDDGGPNLKKAL